MPRTIYVRPYGNGAPVYAERHAILPSEKVQTDLSALEKMVSYLEENPRRDDILDDLITKFVFTWPWYYPYHLQELRSHPIVVAMPDWARENIFKVFDDIENGELVNTGWSGNPFVEQS